MDLEEHVSAFVTDRLEDAEHRVRRAEAHAGRCIQDLTRVTDLHRDFVWSLCEALGAEAGQYSEAEILEQVRKIARSLGLMRCNDLSAP